MSQYQMLNLPVMSSYIFLTGIPSVIGQGLSILGHTKLYCFGAETLKFLSNHISIQNTQHVRS